MFRNLSKRPEVTASFEDVKKEFGSLLNESLPKSNPAELKENVLDKYPDPDDRKRLVQTQMHLMNAIRKVDVAKRNLMMLGDKKCDEHVGELQNHIEAALAAWRKAMLYLDNRYNNNQSRF